MRTSPFSRSASPFDRDLHRRGAVAGAIFGAFLAFVVAACAGGPGGRSDDSAPAVDREVEAPPSSSSTRAADAATSPSSARAADATGSPSIPRAAESASVGANARVVEPSSPGSSARPADAPRVGPARGALVVAGGGRLGPEIVGRFVELAGGLEARIVVIPTAGTRDSFPDDWRGLEMFREAGVRQLTVLHTRDPEVADAEAFVAPLREATGVWIPGGRQWRLADAYLGTRTLDELFALLDRGGVIGGSSAGASIQASYMVRGAPEGNHIMMAPGHEEGVGFLRDIAVDQHLLARGREEDLLEVIARYPELLGIGLDEGTAIVVRGDRAEVIGRSKAAFYNAADAGGRPYYFLEAGGVFDLARRVTVRRRAEGT